MTDLMFTVPKIVKRNSPVPFLFGNLFAINQRRLYFVSALAILSSGANGIAYIAIFPLLNIALGMKETVDLGPFSIHPTSSLAWPLMLGIVILLIFAIQARYAMHKLSLETHRASTQKSAETGLVQFQKYLSSNPHLESDPRLLSAFRITIWQIPFSCGLVMKRLAVGGADIIQIAIFLLFLLFLNVYITFAFIILLAAFSVVYAKSLNLVAANAIATYSRDHLSREHLKAAFVGFGERTPDRAKEVVSAIYTTGPLKEMLDRRLDFRKEMQKGPAIVEHVYPMAVILLPSLLLLMGASENATGRLLVFILVLRHVIALLQSLAGALIVMSQQLPLIALYQDISKNCELSQLFRSPLASSDNDPGDLEA